MPTEDGSDLTAIEAEVAAGSTRASFCGVCQWIETRSEDEQAVWDRICAKPSREAAHAAIYAAMKSRGLPHRSSKPLESHRRSRHRVH